MAYTEVPIPAMNAAFKAECRQVYRQVFIDQLNKGYTTRESHEKAEHAMVEYRDRFVDEAGTNAVAIF